MTKRDYLVLDIETVPDTSRWQRPELAPGHEAPFPPTWAHRVIVVGCLWLDSDYRLRRIGVIGDEPRPHEGSPDALERDLLVALSRFVGSKHPTLVTYNGRAFDLPVIALRSLAHGVALPWYYRGKGVRYRYSEDGHLDLCDWLADHGATRSGSLDALARLCGLPGKVGVDGSQVEGLYRSGHLDDIQRYCLADVTQTAFLFLRFRLLQGELTPAQYRHVARELFEALALSGRATQVLEAIDREVLFACADASPTGMHDVPTMLAHPALDAAPAAAEQYEEATPHPPGESPEHVHDDGHHQAPGLRQQTVPEPDPPISEFVVDERVTLPSIATDTIPDHVEPALPPTHKA